MIEECKYMLYKKQLLYLSIGFIASGLIISIIGLILLIGFKHIIDKNISLGVVSWGLGFISIGIALYSQYNSRVSDERLESQIDDNEKLIEETKDLSGGTKELAEQTKSLVENVNDTSDQIKELVEELHINTEQSRDTMNVQNQTQFYNMTTALQRIRFDFFKFERDFFRHLNDKNLIRRPLYTIDDMRFRIELTTWETVTYMRNAVRLKDYAVDDDQRILMKYLIIIIKNILTEAHYDERVKLLTNRHVEHLLISLQEANKLEVFDEYEKELLKLLETPLGKKPKRQKLINYINFKKNYLKNTIGLDKIFVPLE